MQRLFGSFPDRYPGAGLLCLRLAAGGALLAQAGTYLSGFLEAGFAAWATLSIALVSGLCLIGGLLTPAAGIVAILGTLLVATGPIPESQLFLRWQGSLLLGAAIVSIVLVGPGAYSIDARLFGRREIVIRR